MKTVNIHGFPSLVSAVYAIKHALKCEKGLVTKFKKKKQVRQLITHSALPFLCFFFVAHGDPLSHRVICFRPKSEMMIQ